MSQSEPLIEAGHTPGPWIAESDCGYSTGSIWAGSAPSGHGPAGKLIANVVGDSAEADANARLIAAAPELLAFAKAHDAYMVDAGFTGPESDALHPKAAENWRACIAVIQSAEGHALVPTSAGSAK